MPGNMGRPAFTFINLYIFCNLQRIINKNIHLGYVCIDFLIRNSLVCLLAMLSTLLTYVEITEYTENLTESEKRKLRKQAKHYVSKDYLLYYAKGETRRVVRETEKHRILRACHSDSTAGKYIFYVF
jgi:putative lipase involved disintegration of autophagic bodies